MGVPLFFLQTRTQLGLWDQAPAVGRICRLDSVPLVPGDYLLTVGCLTGERQLDLLEHVAASRRAARFFDSGYLPHQLNGPMLVRAAWDVRGANIDEPLAAAR